ncbi:TetR/AcrR family transcriptional regulator [Oceanobacillus saliphilus]|uniref:TetR/AcrR family transcriptional regulator n=1 Tax=Oceanobacillus saliphilus TaxID=2925834 RepID=UPI00201D6CE4|nr:TetR/AcrR family transcriptional regulator [Oceanobacillus saliphilus]
MNKRTTKALLTKKKISEAALRLFNEKSFSEVTVDEIIKETNTSKGAFYTHFKSKHDIFLEKFKEIDDYYVNELVHLIAKEEKYADRLEIFLRLQMTYIEKDLGWDVIRTIYEVELNIERDSFFLIPDRPLYSILLDIFVNGQKNEEFRNDLSPEKMMDICLRTMRGILYDWALRKANFSLIEEHGDLFRVMIRGLMK